MYQHFSTPHIMMVIRKNVRALQRVKTILVLLVLVLLLLLYGLVRVKITMEIRLDIFLKKFMICN